MLSKRPVMPILLATDLDESRAFYEKKLGLTVIEASDTAVDFQTGGDTRLRLSASDEGTKDTQTQMTWVVDDLRVEVDELRSQGVEFEEYDNDEVTTVDGIADQGEAYVAWITDPAGNVLGIEEPK